MISHASHISFPVNGGIHAMNPGLQSPSRYHLSFSTSILFPLRHALSNLSYPPDDCQGIQIYRSPVGHPEGLPPVTDKPELHKDRRHRRFLQDVVILLLVRIPVRPVCARLSFRKLLPDLFEHNRRVLIGLCYPDARPDFVAFCVWVLRAVHVDRQEQLSVELPRTANPILERDKNIRDARHADGMTFL